MSLDEGLLLTAKRHVLKNGITMSDLIRDLLARETNWSGTQAVPRLDLGAALPVLRAYSEGRLTRRQVMVELGSTPDRHAKFVEAMNQLVFRGRAVGRREILEFRIVPDGGE